MEEDLGKVPASEFSLMHILNLYVKEHQNELDQSSGGSEDEEDGDDDYESDFLDTRHRKNSGKTDAMKKQKADRAMKQRKQEDVIKRRKEKTHRLDLLMNEDK